MSHHNQKDGTTDINKTIIVKGFNKHFEEFIEDVQSIDWINLLRDEVPSHLTQFIKIYDLRPNKNRYDDIVFTIDKSGI